MARLESPEPGPWIAMGEFIPMLWVSEAQSSCLDGDVHDDVERVLIAEDVIEKRLDVLSGRIIPLARGFPLQALLFLG